MLNVAKERGSMAYTTLVSVVELKEHLNHPDWAIVDCRFSLGEPERGRQDYRQAHIPGAIYAHLNEDLSGLILSGQTGRHPLPPVNLFAQTLSHWGIDSQVQVVAYDDAGGAIAARLWWMLRWLSHEAVAVLDGGWLRWQETGYPVRPGEETRPARTFVPEPRPRLLAEAAEVQSVADKPNYCLLDARSVDRYRGQNETIDPVAGHIPGAISAPYADNLGPDGLFLPPEALRARYEKLLGDVPPGQAIVYCGSGVTAAHNLLAMAYAGLGDGQLYAGSWSEWITEPDRPVVTE
jgi:thiosulfate/3-mercaptopyruvate sulfurtransferase